MNILLVGGHQTTNFLIKSLLSSGHKIMVINQDNEWCHVLADKYEIITICGNGSNAGTLKLAHAEIMDVVISLYDQDATNLIVCELAKKQFNVKHTFTIINDPKNAELFQSFGIDQCVNIAKFLSELVEQHTIEENIIKHLPVKDSRVVVSDVILSANAPSLNKKLWEIGFPPQSIIACILREEETIIPQGNTILLAGDKVVVISSLQSLDSTISLLNGKN